MEKLVFTCILALEDECFDEPVAIPFEYESAEKLLSDFLGALDKAKKEKSRSFLFMGEFFDTDHFYKEHIADNKIKVRPLKQWFEEEKAIE